MECGFRWGRNLLAWEEELVAKLYIYSQGCMAWTKLAPSRFNTKARLFRIGTRGNEDGLCTLCKEDPEAIEHLLRCKILGLVSFDVRHLVVPAFQKFDKKLWTT